MYVFIYLCHESYYTFIILYNIYTLIYHNCIMLFLSNLDVICCHTRFTKQLLLLESPAEPPALEPFRVWASTETSERGDRWVLDGTVWHVESMPNFVLTVFCTSTNVHFWDWSKLRTEKMARFVCVIVSCFHHCFISGWWLVLPVEKIWMSFVESFQIFRMEKASYMKLC